MTHADKIRKYAQQTYIQPAIQRQEREVQIRAGDVHKAMQLRRQHPNVCQALRSKIFLKENSLRLKGEEGPQSGQSSSMIFTYQFDGISPQQSTDRAGTGSNLLKLLELKGIGKELFTSLGGGETFIRNERKAFADAVEKQDRERGLL